MAVPTISATQSILTTRVGQQISFQPRASDTPTSWALTSGALPSGISLNTTTGKVTGVPTEAGVFEFGLKATNGSGTSTEVEFSMGVERVPFISDGSIEIDWDLGTGHIRNPRDTTLPPLFLKRGDRFMLSVGFTKDGILQELPVELLTLGIRRFEDDEATILLNDGVCEQIGDYDTTRYRILVDLREAATHAALTALLADFEQDGGAATYVLTEMEAVLVQEVFTGAGPEELPLTARTFTSILSRDLVNTTAAPEI